MKRWKQYAAFAITSCMIFNAMPMSAFAYEEADTQQESMTEEIVTEEATTQEEISTEASTMQEEVITEETTTQEEVMTEEATTQEEVTEEATTQEEMTDEESLSPKTSSSDIGSTETDEQSGRCGDYTYWDYKDGVLQIYRSGSMYSYDMVYDGKGNITGTTAPWNGLPIEQVKIWGSVENVGAAAFTGCTTLREVELDSDITSIGADAFRGCTNLSKINLPDTLKEIGTNAFSDCASLNGVTLPDGVQKIGSGTFYGCSSLTFINLENVYEYEWYAFGNCTSLNGIDLSNVSKLGRGIFAGCTSLTSVTLNNVSEMDIEVFRDCSSLSKVTIASELELSVIPEHTFEGTELEEIRLPNHIREIGQDAFLGCKYLKKVILPKSVETIGFRAFEESPVEVIEIHNKDLKIPKEMATWLDKGCKVYGYNESTAHTFARQYGFSFISLDEGQCGENAFWSYDIKTKTLTIKGTGALYDYENYRFVEQLWWCTSQAPWADLATEAKNIVIESGITYVGNGDFANMKACTNLSLPDTLQEIGDFGFAGMEALEAVKLPKGLKKIGSYGLSYASKLKELTLPESVTSIGTSVFAGNEKLEKITLSHKITTISGHAFYGCYTLKTIVLPAGLKKIEGSAFYDCGGLTELKLPDSVTEIGDLAFSGCRSLKKITIPKNVKKLENHMFDSCEALTEVVLQEGLNMVDYCVFRECDNLKKVTFPRSLKELAKDAFDYNDGIEEVTFLSRTTKIDPKALIETSKAITVRGYTGSTAQTFAKEQKYAFKSIDAEQVAKETVSVNSIKASDGKIQIGWSDAYSAQKYKIYRKTGSGSYTLLKTVEAKTKTYTDKAVKSGNTYTYKVVATVGNASSKAKEKAVYYLAAPKPAVMNVAAGIQLSWKKINGATGYYIFRKEGTGKLKKIATLKATVLSYTDKNVKTGKKYTYVVASYKQGKATMNGVEKSIIRLARPSKLTATRKTKSSPVVLKWTKVTGAKGYYIYRKTKKGSYTKIATVKSTTLTYTDKKAKKGVTYTYAIKAYNGTSTSANIEKTK